MLSRNLNGFVKPSSKACNIAIAIKNNFNNFIKSKIKFRLFFDYNVVFYCSVNLYSLEKFL